MFKILHCYWLNKEKYNFGKLTLQGFGVGKIHVCIAYKTYAAKKLMDLLHSQLITCTM